MPGIGNIDEFTPSGFPIGETLSSPPPPSSPKGLNVFSKDTVASAGDCPNLHELFALYSKGMLELDEETLKSLASGATKQKEVTQTQRKKYDELKDQYEADQKAHETLDKTASAAKIGTFLCGLVGLVASAAASAGAAVPALITYVAGSAAVVSGAFTALVHGKSAHSEFGLNQSKEALAGLDHSRKESDKRSSEYGKLTEEHHNSHTQHEKQLFNVASLLHKLFNVITTK